MFNSKPIRRFERAKFQNLIRFGLVMVGLVMLMACTGCMQRRITIRTNPPGALVYMDDVEIGHSPVSQYITHYGTRTIRVEKDRYQTVEIQQRIDAPWYQIPPLDFFSELFYPFEKRDEREVFIELQPLKPTNETEVMDRANQIRQNANRGVFVPR